MTILTAQDVALVDCCGCLPDLCEAPRQECESLLGQSNSEDDDYTDALEAYTNSLSAWKSELLDQWYSDRDYWLSLDPERDPEDFPIPEPTPRNDEDFSEYPGPSMPAGYLEADQRGSFAPYVRPTGLPEDDIPTLYRRYDFISEGIFYNGSATLYNPEGSYEELITYTYNNTQIPDNFTGVRTGNEIVDGECVSGLSGFPDPPGASLARFLADYNAYEDVSELVCTATTHTLSYTGSISNSGRSTLVGCPGPWDGDEEVNLEIERSYEYEDTISEGVTKTQIGVKAKNKIPATWPEAPEGTSCSASFSYDWPTIQEVGSGNWPSCEDYFSIPAEAFGYATARKVRYRMGIPDGDRWEATTPAWVAWNNANPTIRGPEPLKTTQDVAHAAWVIEKAAWDAADPATRGDEPIEPTPRSTYELQWDEVFFPKGYDATINDPSVTPPVPLPSGWVHPQIPDPDAPSPSLVASRSWVYDVDEFSGWFEIQPPNTEGQTRVVNMMIICYRSAALGQKPTAYGEVYEL